MLKRWMWAALCCIAVAAWAADEKDEKWDVANPPDETYEIEIDVEEGTWLSLDVSPDGKDIVFDLLGDIYIMPITGGEAKQLAGGLPWEMQPAFSPDGKHIAYTSDRDGGDNLWIMKRDGSDARAVTKETFRLLNSPAWSPDGQYLVGRKHYTGTRSLGAGEIWLYHISGGSGVQLVKRPNDQKDLGEPAFSPDGRYIYYSQDTTPGSTFQYSKNPTPGIYTIRRYDREKSETEDFIGGLGGAIRPTPSPDGKWIAFVRRVDYKTALYLHDMASGREIMLTDQLDRDMQETWAVHGVNARFAWTPDNKSIVYWAGGKIHQIEVASRKDKVIPFRVKTKHTMVKTVRVPTEVAPAGFDVKMLRWVSVSPDEKKVIYQALGHLYVKELPNGTPRRLTKQSDHFEYYPSFSRDGKSIVYVSWDDEDMGAVRVVSANGGEGKAVTSEKGVFTEPAFSPDDKHIVYNKIQDGYLISGLWSREPGIYVIPAEGGDAERIHTRGGQLHFGADNDRVFFVTVDSGLSRTLRSIGLDGQEEREHASSAKGGEFRVSPDGKWLAFTEPYHVNVIAFPVTGVTVSIGPGAKNLPSGKLSAEAGNYLHWRGDGEKVFWSLGNKLYERSMADVFAFHDNAPDELPDPVSEGTAIGFEADYDRPAGVIAVRGARILTMNENRDVIEDGVIVVEGNRIKALGVKGDVTIPSGAKVIDASGHTVMPGIVDVHAHGPYGSAEMVPQQNWSLYAGLTFGVTTIHDPSADTSTILAAAEMAKAGMILSPRIFTTGTILYGATVPQFTADINNFDDALFHVRRMKAAGAVTVKSYNQPRRDQRQQVIKAGREEDVMVLPEGGSLFQHNLSMVADGHTGIEHSIPVARAYADVIQFWSKSNTFYTPTLVVGYGGIWGENYWYATTDVWKHERLSTFVPDFVLEPRSRRREIAPDFEYNHIRNAEVCKQFVDAGIHVMIGAHGQREGLGAHWELWMFAQGGMTPMEALYSATYSGAAYLGMEGDIGSLEAGKLADLVVLSENPLEDIYNSDKIRYVMLNGRLYDAATMNETGNREKARAPFFFETGDAGSSMNVNLARTRCGCFTSH